ncbi:MAG: hypothetical protein ACR2N3_16310 [Pyrinomonadaceae bacterium]
MDELNEIWAKMLCDATIKAQAAGRADIAEYLALKSANDSLRAIACRWLFDSFLELSDEANRRGIKLDIENENPHRFTVDYSTMVGSLIKFNYGLRNLTVEAGWTRTPQDGFIRGGGLARARISHFGMSKSNAELLLVRSSENIPQWYSVDREDGRQLFNSNNLRKHFEIFLGFV